MTKNSHEPFDDSTKAFYRQLFENWGMSVETEREVFFRGRSIDVVVTCTDEDQTRLQNTAFSHFRWLNARLLIKSFLNRKSGCVFLFPIS